MDRILKYTPIYKEPNVTDDSPYRSPADVDDTPKLGREHLKDVATGQRNVIFCLLANMTLGANATAAAIGGVAGAALVAIVALGLVAVMMFCVHRLSSALEIGAPAAYAFAMIIPCGSLIVLLILSQTATSYLQDNGVKVGLLGANPDSI